LTRILHQGLKTRVSSLDSVISIKTSEGEMRMRGEEFYRGWAVDIRLRIDLDVSSLRGPLP
jgi:hypothetical protein